MNVFVAGATGAVGRPLVAQLVDAGHRVTGSTRSPEKAAALRGMGAEPAVCDALNAADLREAVLQAEPEVVVHQLTALPQSYDPRKIDYGPTNRLKREGTRNLIEAGLAAGARRLISQSIAFIYAPEGAMVVDESARPWEDAPSPFHDGVEAALEHERATLETPGIEGLVLRYGQFYGPDTYYASDGNIAREVRRRRFPIVGRGGGNFSFIHADDAAASTVAALDHGEPGIYNVTDDEPTPLHEWLPFYADLLGAKPPRRVPKFLARIIAGRFATIMATDLRGASNAKAKRELGWRPRYASWRQGFVEALG
jgi:nucleoside-diphosphate-sugar epimerase